MRIPQHSCYGKLPSAREYVRHACDGRVDGQIQCWVDEFAQPIALIPELVCIRYLLRQDTGTGLVAGSLWPSSDAGGLRTYPFSVFRPMPWSERDSVFAAWSACEARYRQLLRARDESELAASLAATEPETELSDLDHSFIPAREWIARVLDGDVDRLALRLWDWRQCLESRNAGAAAILRIPLSDLQPAALQAGVILGAVTDQDGILIESTSSSVLHLCSGRARPADLIDRSASTPARTRSITDRAVPPQMEGFMEFLASVRSAVAADDLRSAFQLINTFRFTTKQR